MKILIIGFGSIGSRHYDNFLSLDCDVAVFSRRKLADKRCFDSLDEAIKKFSPDMVVVANETSLHGSTLNQLQEYPTIQRILVEKPLYGFLPAKRPGKFLEEKVKVAFNLRFHPLIKELKKNLQNQTIINWHAYVGQHLASWRPGRDYKEVYSSQKIKGGGPLRDLSHEIDLLSYFAGNINLINASGGHFSNLESDTEDTISLILKTGSCPHANIHLNCIDRIGQRFMTVHTNTDTHYLDFISGKLKNSTKDISVPFERNTSYLEMAKAFLNDSQELCSFESGWKINQIIEQAESMI